MIKVLGTYKEKNFEYFYVFIMVIYMAQMTSETSRMVGGISGNPIPFLIPIVLTIILLSRNKVSFNNKNLRIVLLLSTIWSVCIIIKEKLYSTEELSYIFFLYYAIIIAFIHCQVFGKRLLALYEHIMVFFAIISIPLWLFGVLVPGIAASFYRLFPETGFGNNVFYLFDWMDPLKGQIYSIPRNAGCSWEPGRFAIMLTLAICFNLLRNGVTFRNNRNVIWLLLSLASTQSTTGYSIAILLYVIFFLKKASIQSVIGLIVILLPIVLGILQLNFMSDKINAQMENLNDKSDMQQMFDYHESYNETGEYLSSLGRFEAIYFESQNIIEDPILGYGRNTTHSYFYNNISSHHGLTGGLLQQFGKYGIPFGLFFYFILYKSSVVIADESDVKKRVAFFFVILLSSVSYVTFCIPVFTAFWFYSLFAKK